MILTDNWPPQPPHHLPSDCDPTYHSIFRCVPSRNTTASTKPSTAVVKRNVPCSTAPASTGILLHVTFAQSTPYRVLFILYGRESGYEYSGDHLLRRLFWNPTCSFVVLASCFARGTGRSIIDRQREAGGGRSTIVGNGAETVLHLRSTSLLAPVLTVG